MNMEMWVALVDPEELAGLVVPVSREEWEVQVVRGNREVLVGREGQGVWAGPEDRTGREHDLIKDCLRHRIDLTMHCPRNRMTRIGLIKGCLRILISRVKGCHREVRHDQIKDCLPRQSLRKSK